MPADGELRGPALPVPAAEAGGGTDAAPLVASFRPSPAVPADPTEAALRAAERHRAELEAVYGAITDGITVVDPSGAIVFANDAMARLAGFACAEEFRAVSARSGAPRPTFELRTSTGASVPFGQWPVSRVLRGEQIQELELQVRRLDTGETRWLSYTAQPVRDRAGVLFLGVIVARDVTERKRADADLAVVTRLYAVLSRVNEVIVRTRDEASLLADVCRIVADEGGFPLVWVGLVAGREVRPAAAAGSATAYLREVLVEVDGELGQGPTGTAVREGRPVVNDAPDPSPAAPAADGPAARHGLRASAAFPLRCGGLVVGALTFYAGTPGAFTAKQVRLLEALCADVSYALDAIEHERQRTQAELALRASESSLREAHRRKDEFLSMLSHELRNPLAPIRSSVFVLRHADPAGEQAARARAVVERQAAHLARLVDDLLDVTRIARGKVQLRRAPVPLRDLVALAAEDFRGMLDARGLAFEVVLPPGEVWVDADPTRLTQVVGNLLNNAAKFTRRGGAVTLSLEVHGRELVLRVRDTGAGIDRELLPVVFDAFVQGERTLARTDGGLGLGLALVKSVVELHGGRVRAHSEGIGMGAEFTVWLPRLDAAAEGAGAGRAAGRGAGGRRVLVVDDNSDAAESLSDLLRLGGHAVEVAYDGPSAIAKAAARPPDVVVCDIGLPGMNGFDVARRLRGDGALRATRLIALTGYAQAEDRARAREAGFDALVAKPPDVDELMRLVAGAR